VQIIDRLTFLTVYM